MTVLTETTLPAAPESTARKTATAAKTHDRIDGFTLTLINALLLLILCALLFGLQVIQWAALALVPVMLGLLIAITRGFGQPPL